MVTNEQIIQLAEHLLKKANLSNTVLFSLEREEANFGAVCYDLDEKIVYFCSEPAFYEFKTLLNTFPNRVNNTSECFLDIQKIGIAHEIGHALQPNLEKRTYALLDMKRFETLISINSEKEFLQHVDRFRSVLVSIESEAWDYAFDLISDEIDKDLFDLIKKISLSTYLHGDILDGEEEFRSFQEFIHSDKNVDIIEFLHDDEGDKILLKIILNKKHYRATCLRGEDFAWVEDSFFRFDENNEKWIPLSSDKVNSSFDFALDALKTGLSMVN